MPTIMVSSTVYGIEEFLDQVYATLTGFGYTVWMSRRGTVPLHPGQTAFENCLSAVENCDVFLGIITPQYGSGRDGTAHSITHQELIRAIESNKPRWLLAHERVVFARRLLRQYRFLHDGSPNPDFEFNGITEFDDIRLVEMYEAAIRDGEPVASRAGNWVQPYTRYQDALEFVSFHFSDLNHVQNIVTNWGTI
jgi:hypothetical protein